MSTPQTAGRDAMAQLRHELSHPPFHAFLGPEPVSADAKTGTVVIRIPYRAEFRRAADSNDIHGGVVAAVIDLAAHAAVAVQTGRMAPTVDLRIDYLRPVPGVDLYATARTLKVGYSIARVDVEIRGAETACLAVGRGTFSTQISRSQEVAS
jgi:uncharacterized protein (TIGR00369 family)